MNNSIWCDLCDEKPKERKIIFKETFNKKVELWVCKHCESLAVNHEYKENKNENWKN